MVFKFRIFQGQLTYLFLGLGFGFRPRFLRFEFPVEKTLKHVYKGFITHGSTGSFVPSEQVVFMFPHIRHQKQIPWFGYQVIQWFCFSQDIIRAVDMSVRTAP